MVVHNYIQFMLLVRAIPQRMGFTIFTIPQRMDFRSLPISRERVFGLNIFGRFPLLSILFQG